MRSVFYFFFSIILAEIDPNKVESILTFLGVESRFGDKPLGFEVICPQNGGLRS